MHRKLTATLALAAPLVTIGAMLVHGQGPVAMGDVKLTGATKKLDVSTGAIPTGGTGPSLKGKLLNTSTLVFNDVTVEVRRTDEEDSAPQGGDTKVSRPNQGGGESEASGTQSSGGAGTIAKVDFGGTGGVGDLKADESVEFEVDLTSVDGSEVEVWITPSTEKGSVHADLLALAPLSQAANSLTSTLDGPAHSHVLMRIRNVDRNSRMMDSLSGEVLPGGSGASLSTVDLYYPHGPYTPQGTAVQVSGNQFTITGFEVLGPGYSYDLLLGFTEPPQQGYSVKVTGSF